MRKRVVSILGGLLFVGVMAAWSVPSQIESYGWASKAELALEEHGMEVVDLIKTGDLALPWTWIWPITSQLNWQTNLHTVRPGEWIITHGFVSIDHRNASWFALVDCGGRRVAQASTEDLPQNPSNWAAVADSILEKGDGWQSAADAPYDFLAETISELLDRTCVVGTSSPDIVEGDAT